MSGVSSKQKKLEHIIFHSEEDEKYSFGLGVTAGYIPEEPKSPDESDRLDRTSYNLGLRVYHTANKITEMLSHVNMIIRMLVVYDRKEIGNDLRAVSKSIDGLKQIKSQNQISEDYLEKLIPRLEAQYETLSSDCREK